MSDLKNVNPDNEEEIESPIEGPPPDWMKTATSSAGSSFKENEAPEWLRNIRAGKGPSTTESKEEASAAGDESTASSAETMSDLERLLAEEGIDLTGVADERPEGAEGMSVKDWMIATSDDEIIRRKIGAEPVEEPVVPQVKPEPLPEAPAPVPSFTQDLVEEELPDWLREISDEVETSPPLAEVAEARPVTAKPVVEEQLPGDEDLPDWLREVSEQVQASAPPAVSDTGPVEEQDELMLEEELPDWLHGISDEPAPVAKPIIETSLGADLEDAGAAEEMPTWLQEVEEEEEETPLQAVTATRDDKLVVTDELPSWLREVEEEGTELPTVSKEPEPEPILPAQPPEAVILEEELPDWLREDEVAALETDLGPDFEPAPYAMAASTDTVIDEENLPDWLRDVQEAQVEAEAELPEFMEAEAEVEEELDEIEEAELPDWLKEVQAEEEIVTPTAPPPQAVTPVPVPLAAEAEIVEEELPDWLREAADESVEAGFGLEAMVETPRAEAREGLPDWLQGVDLTEEEPFEPSEPSPDEFGFGAVAEEIEPALVQEELPDWLKEVQLESEEMAVLEEDVVAEVGGPELEESLVVETELPDWLQLEEEIEAELPAEPVIPEPAVAAVAGPEWVAPVEFELAEIEPILAEAPAAVVPEEVVVPAPAGELGLADIPDWLKKLREGDVEEEAVAVLPIKPLPKPVVAGPMVESIMAPEPGPLAEAAIPEEASERLEQARAARDAGNIDEALQYYENLVSSGLQLDRVIEDIKQTIKSYPANAMLYQVMGDAMMKDGRLQSALDAYRTALSKL